MSSQHLLIVLAVATVTLTAVAALGRLGVPPAVVLVVAGLIIGFLPFVPDVELNPDLVLLGMLPLLVFEAAGSSSPTAFLRNARSIGLLAVGLVLATAAAVAVAAHYIGHLSWAMAFVLGTAVGPTDAAAATSIARRLGLPRRLAAILEGEALFNDATALVLYAAAVTAATTGHFALLHATGSVLYSSAVGIGLGLGVGLLGASVRRYVDDPAIEIAGSILLAYAAYIPAEVLHASGVLATVVAGIYLGRSGSGVSSARSRLQASAFWHTLAFLLNAALFILVGLSFHTFTSASSGSTGRLLLTGTVVVLTVIAVRLAWMEGTGLLTRLRRLRAPHPQDGWRERTLIGWSGMRGAITLAALLAVPRTTHAGAALAGRDDIIYLGFAVIITTLVLQGMTLPILVKRLGLPEHPAVALAEQRARLRLADAVLEHLDASAADEAVSPELVDALRAQYLARRGRLERADRPDRAGAGSRTVDADRAIRHELIEVQRQALEELRRNGAIGTTTMRSIQHELDLEDARLASVQNPAPVASKR